MKTQLKQLLTLLDLTSLNDDDTAEKIHTFAQQAVTPYGNVAAVCIYPAFVTTARKALDALPGGSSIPVATVVNFPTGNEELPAILQQTRQALTDGAEEIDLVLPYTALLDGDTEIPIATVQAVAEMTHNLNGRLKVIIESGALKNNDNITNAAEIAIAGGADFIKTSTGKIPVGATQDAARVILATLAEEQASDRVGIKLSGGIRTTDDALAYLALIRAQFGEDWIRPARVRFGASSLLADIIKHLQ